VLFRSHQLRSSSKFIFDPMDAIVLKEVLDNINSLHTWECMLNFVDGRHPDGYTDICQYLYNNHCNTTALVGSTASFTKNCFYYFDTNIYGDGIDSEEKLVKDLINTARSSGFKLVVRNSKAKNVALPWTKKILLACSRGIKYQGNKLHELERNNKSGDQMVLCEITDVDNGNKKKRKTFTTRAICADDLCPFSFSIFLHGSEKRWYIISTPNEHPSQHRGHRKLQLDEIRTSTNLESTDIEKLNLYNSMHLTSTQAATLFNRSDANFNLLPSQVKYITRKEALLARSLTEVTSSAEKLLLCLQERPEVTYMTLTDDVGEASGLIVATNKGRPSKLTGILAQQFSPEDIRKQLMLREDQSLLLAVCWVSDDERRLAEMFPEVLYMDVTSQTNNEKRPLFLVAGKDSCGKSFTAARIFLPSEQKWIFRWIFQNCLPALLGETVTKRNKVVMTDGDSHCYDAFKEAACHGGPWEGSVNILCQWHLLSYAWKREVSIFAPVAKPHLNIMASTSYKWIQSWFYDIETRAEFVESHHRLMTWLDGKNDEGCKPLREAIRDFIIRKLLPHERSWLRYHRLHVRCFDETSNSLVESQNSRLKTGSMAVKSNMSLATSACSMMDQSELTHSTRAITVAAMSASTTLWSLTTTAKLLTPTAEKIVVENFNKRHLYSLLQMEEMKCLLVWSL